MLYTIGFVLLYAALLLIPNKKVDDDDVETDANINDDVETDANINDDVETNAKINDDYKEAEISDDDELFTLQERMNSLEKMLTYQSDSLVQMNRIERLSEFIESEKQKGDLLTRLTITESKKLIYEFKLTDFNNFCRLVYEDIKASNRYKGRTHIMKKIGQLWREMSDYEKNTYKTD